MTAQDSLKVQDSLRFPSFVAETNKKNYSFMCFQSVNKQ